MMTRANAFPRPDSVPPVGWWVHAGIERQRVLADAGFWGKPGAAQATGPSHQTHRLDEQFPCSPASATLLRRTAFVSPASVRPFFVVCAILGWRRFKSTQLAAWSGIPINTLRRRLAMAGLTPAGVAAWNIALHAAWMLDVAALPAAAVVARMELGRPSALGAVLGARGVRYAAGRIQAGAFATALERYVSVLRAAFPE